jgi:uncharacterized membrane protein
VGHIKETIFINAPVEKVWEFMVDYRRAPEWQSNVVEVKEFDGTPGEPGFAYTAVYKAMGRRLESRSTIVRSERPRFLEEEGSMAGNGKVTMLNTLETTREGGTALTFTLEYDVGSFFLAGVADKLVFERSIERDVRHSSENLKALVEAERPVLVWG